MKLVVSVSYVADVMHSISVLAFVPLLKGTMTSIIKKISSFPRAHTLP